MGASTAGGLQRRSILADVIKLGRLLEEHSLSAADSAAPLAYVCVLDNHHRKTFDLEALVTEVREGPYHHGVRVLATSADTKPAAPVGSAVVW